MRRTTSLLFLSLLIPVLVAVGCGDDGGGSSSAGADSDLPKVPDAEYVDETGESTITIDTKDNTFTPKYVTVSPGTKIVFENKGRTAHNVIPSIEDQFESIPVDDLQPGDTATLSFDDAGDYPYFCSLHGTKTKGMIGAIRVEG